MATKRLEFIDFAKGICIILVVLVHIDRYGIFYFSPAVSGAFFSFRMPLYFIISGLFLSFKPKVGGGKSIDYKSFIEKKINRLLIPLVFFTLLTNLYNYVCFRLGLHSFFELRSSFLMAVDESYSGNPMWNNGPIFFVLWLFITYMFVAVLNFMCRGNIVCMWILAIVLGVVGFYSQLPLTIDTAMTCTPFVLFGMTLKKYTNFLTFEVKNSSKILMMIGAVAVLLLLILISPSPNYFYKNEYGTTCLEMYLYGILGTMSVLMFAKAINKFASINYIGRYSIVILGVHNILINDLYKFSAKIGMGHILQELFVLIIVLFVSIVCVKLFIKYIPKLVAQDDFIKISW